MPLVFDGAASLSQLLLALRLENEKPITHFSTTATYSPPTLSAQTQLTRLALKLQPF
jgi:hypothetical protein